MSDKEIAICPDCYKYTVFEQQNEYRYRKEAFPSEEVWEDLIIRLLSCHECSYPMLVKESRIGSLVDDIHPIRTEILYPLTIPKGENGTTPLPSEDMPEEIAEIYQEARSILIYSPRSSAALLRLALQNLCKYLGLPGRSINEDIKKLVERDISLEIQQSLDIVRIIGNNTFHPGEINLDDNPEIVSNLFTFINYLVEILIAHPRRIKEMYADLPQKLIEAVEKRDNQI